MDGTPEFPGLLEALLRTPGPSGRERQVAELLAKTMPESVEIARDGAGSILMRAAGRSGAHPRLAVIGHMDEVGLMVIGIEDDGMIVFGPVGNVRPETLVAQRVRILTEAGSVPGVIGREPPWFPGEVREPPAIRISSMRIDVGARDRDEASVLVRIGDAAVIDVEPVRLAHGHAASRAFDDRFGVYVAAEVVRRLAAEGGAEVDVVGIGTVQEETAFAGAHTAPEAAEPDLAIVVDVDYAAPAPREDGWPRDGVGQGVVIVRGTVVDDDLALGLVALAQRESIPHLVRALPGSTETDADVVALTRSGVPTAVLSIALRNMHTPVEVANLHDVEACVRLVMAYARELRAG
jgi:putative aminopeptidase FrvX